MILTLEALTEMLKYDSIAGATGTDPLLKTAKVMLYVNNIAPTNKTVIGDLTEASWTGYARSAAVTWALPILSNNTGLPTIVADAKTFTVTTNAGPQTAYGYALVTTVTAVDHLLAIAPFDTPINPGPGTEIIVQARIGMPDTPINPPGDVTFE
jgi:hypothetical protein